jgi:peptide/nickel transport system substrate-binding protein
MSSPHPSLRGVVRALSLSVVLALAAAGCSSGTGSSTDGPSRSDEPATLTIATSFGIDDLDPLENSFWGPEFGYVELLMRPARDGNPTPWVLQSLTPVDERTWTLTLRDNVVFENGKRLDADALVSLLTYCNEKNESFAAAVHLASVTATDDHTVTLKTAVPVPGLANIFADESNVPVFDVAGYEAYLASKAKPEALLQAGLYTGPYRMTSLTEQAAQLEPVADYWGGKLPLSRYTIKFVPEATSRVQAVQAGEADIALYMPTDVARTLQGRKDAYYVTGKPSGTTFSVQLRNAGPYADTRVRRALFAAIDYRALAEDVMDGLAEVATSVFGPGLPYAVDTQSTDLDQAKKLLDEAGWVPGADGVRVKDGQPLRLRLLSYPQQPDSNSIAVAMQSQLKPIGFDVKVSQVPDLTVSRKGTDWDAAIVGDSLLSFALSPEDGLRSDLVTGGSQNFMKVSDPELDRLVAELSATFDQTKRTELLQQIQRVIHDNALWAATVMRLPAVVTNARWKDYEPPIANLWVDATTAPTP